MCISWSDKTNSIEKMDLKCAQQCLYRSSPLSPDAVLQIRQFVLDDNFTLLIYISGKSGHGYGCWCLGSLHRQVIRWHNWKHIVSFLYHYSFRMYLWPYCDLNFNYNLCDNITLTFPNVVGGTVDFWEWIRKFIPHVTEHMIIYPCRH